MFNVLVIEPDKVLAKIYRQHLLLADIKADFVCDGHEAIDYLDKHHTGAVVLELQLAANSGIEFLHEFRSYKDWQNIPVVVNSSVPKENFGVDDGIWRRLGVTRYLYKPKSTLNQLIGILKTLESNA